MNARILRYSTLQELKEVIPMLSLPWGSIVLMEGALGVGKTEFVRHFTELRFGASRVVQSPTFTLENIYRHQDWSIHHFDLYRLQSWEEWMHFDVLGRVDRSRAIAFIEWANRFHLDQWLQWAWGSGWKLVWMHFSFRSDQDGHGRMVKTEFIQGHAYGFTDHKTS